MTEVLHYDAFTTTPGTGNPAGVVLDAEGLSDVEMQRIAARVGFSETAFVVPSATADLCLRYFTPGYEVDLCGHATMASFAALVEAGRIGPGRYLTETKAGTLPMDVALDGDRPAVTMRQAAPRFEPYDGVVADVASVLGLDTVDIDTALPIVYGSTGLWSLVIPIRGLEPFGRMRPQNARFPEILRQIPTAAIHAFCRETIDPSADMHARHFAPPATGLVEDPVTGTASGVLGAYWARYIAPGASEYRVRCEQGTEMGRAGSVGVHVLVGDPIQVSITGTAVRTAILTIEPT